MKLLILIIYSDGDEYRDMLQIQRSYLHNYQDVYSYFVTFRQDQIDPLVVEKDMIYIKGEEGYLNITQKTVEALDYLMNSIPDIDFVIRSNISTIINIPKLIDYCQELPKTNVYTSGQMFTLSWLDPKFGIHDSSLWGTKYASGTSIILSSDIAKHMLQNKQNIRHDVVDDVSIGRYIQEYVPSSYFSKYPSFAENVDVTQKSTGSITNIIFFRNKQNDRNLDVEKMQAICNILYDNIREVEGFSVQYPSTNISFAIFIICFTGFLFLFALFTLYKKNRSIIQLLLFSIILFFVGLLLYQYCGTWKIDVENFEDKQKINMNIYVITMKRKERLENIAEQQNKISQEIQLFDAVRGDKLDIDQLIKEGVLSRNADFLNRIEHKRIVGCFLSHYTIFEKIKTSATSDYTLIFEDDFEIVGDDLISEINDIIQTLNAKHIDFDMIYLGNLNENKGNPITNSIYHFDEKTPLWGMHAYIVNNSNIDKILENTKVITHGNDSQIELAAKYGKLNIITIYPYLVSIMQNNFSTIHNKYIDPSFYNL